MPQACPSLPSVSAFLPPTAIWRPVSPGSGTSPLWTKSKPPRRFQGRAHELALPLPPKQFLHYFVGFDCPRTRLRTG